MGRLIVSAQTTMDCVMDQLEGRFDPEGEAGVHGLEQPRAADAVILGRETYELDESVAAGGLRPSRDPDEPDEYGFSAAQPVEPIP